MRGRLTGWQDGDALLTPVAPTVPPDRWPPGIRCRAASTRWL